jgi:hypothetical protein
LIIHKQSKHKKEFTVCGLKKILFPNAVTRNWEKVTCENCKRLMASNELAFWKFKLKCKHHINNKIINDGKICYYDYCTMGELDVCNRHTCKILNGGTK